LAIAFDANLGATDGTLAGVTLLTLTTSAAAAAASRVVVFISYFDTVNNVSSVSVGGNAAALDKHVANGSDKFDIWSVHLAGGLASSSTIQINVASTSGGGGTLIGAASFTGVATSGALVTTNSATGAGASWSSGAATNTGQPDAVYAGGSGNEDPTATPTSTATSGTEIHDRYRATDQQGFATGYKIVSTVASDVITGTFSNAGSTANTGGLAIYAAAASSSATAAPLTFNAIPFMQGVI
jgi:hypothetical protein